MSKDVQHLNTPQEVLQHWQDLLAHEPEGMPYNDPEQISGRMMSVLLDSDHFGIDDVPTDWQCMYPNMAAVFDSLALLDQAETFEGEDHAYEWQNVKKHVAALARVLEHEKPEPKPRKKKCVLE